MNTESNTSPVVATVTVKTETPVDLYRVRCLLCSALEGGSNYWYLIDKYEFAPGLEYADFRLNGRMQNPEEYWHPAQLLATTPGCAAIFSVPEDDDGKTYRLDLDAIAKGLQIMADKYPRHWANFVNENDDAETGDVFLQCCLFGEIVFG